MALEPIVEVAAEEPVISENFLEEIEIESFTFGRDNEISSPKNVFTFYDSCSYCGPPYTYGNHCIA